MFCYKHQFAKVNYEGYFVSLVLKFIDFCFHCKNMNWFEAVLRLTFSSVNDAVISIGINYYDIPTAPWN